MKDSPSCRRSIPELPQPVLMESPSPGLDQPLQGPVCAPRAQWAPSPSCCPSCAWVWPHRAKGWCWIPHREGSTAEPTTLNLQLLRMGRVSPGTQTPRCPWWADPKPPGPHGPPGLKADPGHSLEGWGGLRTGHGPTAGHSSSQPTMERCLSQHCLTQGTSKHLCNNPGHWNEPSLETGGSSQLPETEGKNTPNSRARTCLVKHGPAEAQWSILVPADFTTLLFFH